MCIRQPDIGTVAARHDEWRRHDATIYQQFHTGTVISRVQHFSSTIMVPTTLYSFWMTLPFPLLEAEKKVRDALQKERFGIISEIDMQAKLKEKLGVEHPPHKILGACNPQLAYDALKENPDIALVLPCNVVLREEKGQTNVSALMPSVALKPFKGLKVQETACKAEEALERVFDDLCYFLPHHHSHSSL